MAFQERNFGIFSTDNKNIGKSSGEFESVFVSDVDDFVRSFMLFKSDDRSNSSDIVTSGDHNFCANFEFEVTDDFVVSEVDFNGVVLFYQRMGESQSSSVVGDDIGNSFGSHSSSFDSAEFKFSFTGTDFGESESSFEIIKKSIVSFAFDQRNNVLNV